MSAPLSETIPFGNNTEQLEAVLSSKTLLQFTTIFGRTATIAPGTPEYDGLDASFRWDFPIKKDMAFSAITLLENVIIFEGPQVQSLFGVEENNYAIHYDELHTDEVAGNILVHWHYYNHGEARAAVVKFNAQKQHAELDFPQRESASILAEEERSV